MYSIESVSSSPYTADKLTNKVQPDLEENSQTLGNWLMLPHQYHVPIALLSCWDTNK